MKINVSWPALPASDQVVGYDLRITFNGAISTIDKGMELTHVIDPASPGTYAFAYRGRNIVGAGQWSASTSITQPPSTPTSPPTVVVTA